MSNVGSQNPSDTVKQFLAKPLKMLIDGRWVDAASGMTFPVFDPATGDVIAQVAEGDAHDVDLAVAAARRAFDGPWSRITPSERTRLLWKLSELIARHGEDLAQLDSLDNGMPLTAARYTSISLSVEYLQYMAGWSTRLEGTTIPLSVPTAWGTFHAYTLREPIGVIGQIIPWNFPLTMAIVKLAPALAAGCTVVLKPAEETPLSALRLGELIQEAGIPDGVVNIVSGYGATAGAALAAHHDVDKVSFTGSTEVGRLLVHAAAGNLKKLSLELGGKSPHIIMDDADVDLAIGAAANAIFFNQGEVCTAGSLLYVHKSLFDRVIEGVAARAKAIRVGPGFDPQSEMGPLVSDRQLGRVCGYFDSGKSQGARALTGGSRKGDKGYFVEPTVFVDTRNDMKIVQEEIFGPVLVAVPFSEPGEIVAVERKSSYGLSAGIWTRDVSRAHRLAAQLKAGTVWVNCYNIYDAALPFGGYKQSGWGREGGNAAMELYTEVKTVCMGI